MQEWMIFLTDLIGCDIIVVNLVLILCMSSLLSLSAPPDLSVLIQPKTCLRQPTTQACAYTARKATFLACKHMLMLPDYLI